MKLSPLAFATFVLTACSGAVPTVSHNASSSSLATEEMTNSAEASSVISMQQSDTSILLQQSSPLSEYAEKTDAEWKRILTPDQYHILREAGTETPFTSPLLDEHRKGTFVSADCGEPLFRSETKYDSGTGWPSFYAPISPDAVIEKTDTTLGMERTEVLSKCGGHLGHVFNDGPQPTGLRYCMNGIALKFIPDEKQ